MVFAPAEVPPKNSVIVSNYMALEESYRLTVTELPGGSLIDCLVGLYNARSNIVLFMVLGLGNRVF
jgi:hypothetical protein